MLDVLEGLAKPVPAPAPPPGVLLPIKSMMTAPAKGLLASHLLSLLQRFDCMPQVMDELQRHGALPVPQATRQELKALRYQTRVVAQASARLAQVAEQLTNSNLGLQAPDKPPPSNPAKGIEQAKERKRRRMPTHDMQNTIIEYVRANHADYLWVMLELAYLCLLRGIEVLTLTDANEVPTGIETDRRKSSNDSIIKWLPRLTEAWKAAHDRRAHIRKAKSIPTPMKAEKHPVLVNVASSIGSLGQAGAASWMDGGTEFSWELTHWKPLAGRNGETMGNSGFAKPRS